MKFKNRLEPVKKVRWAEWVFVTLGLLMAVRTGANVVRLAGTGNRLSGMHAQVEAAKIENLQLRGELAWVSSDEFVEKEAREKLGMAKEGEVIIILPEPEETELSQNIGRIEPEVEDDKPNWKKWWDLYVRI